MKKFCRKCYQHMIKKGLISPDLPIENIVFKCNVDLYSINAYGEFVILKWNCDKQRYEEIKDPKLNDQTIH